jgi:hypothetical protein
MCRKLEHDHTHQPFDLEADAASKERSRRVVRRKTLGLSRGVVTGQVGVTGELSRSPKVRID